MREEPACRTGLWTSFCMFVHSISSCQDSVSIAVSESQNKTTLASLRWFLHNPLHVSQENLVIGSNHWNSKVYFALLHIACMRKLYAKQMQPGSFPPGTCKRSSEARQRNADQNLIFMDQSQAERERRQKEEHLRSLHCTGSPVTHWHFNVSASVQLCSIMLLIRYLKEATWPACGRHIKLFECFTSAVFLFY